MQRFTLQLHKEQHFQSGVAVLPRLGKTWREMHVDACCKAATHL